MPGLGRGKKAKGRTAAPKRAKGGRSGNPAKRALEQRQAEARRDGGDGEGTDVVAGLELPAAFELPDQLKGLLPPSDSQPRPR